MAARSVVAKADATWTCWHSFLVSQVSQCQKCGKGRRDLDLLALPTFRPSCHLRGGGKGRRDLDLLARYPDSSPRLSNLRVAKADATWTCWHWFCLVCVCVQSVVAKADATWTCWHHPLPASLRPATAGGKGRRDLDLLAPPRGDDRRRAQGRGKGRRDLDLLAQALPGGSIRPSCRGKGRRDLDLLALDPELPCPCDSGRGKGRRDLDLLAQRSIRQITRPWWHVAKADASRTSAATNALLHLPEMLYEVNVLSGSQQIGQCHETVPFHFSCQ